jgi:hypothetical protein
MAESEEFRIEGADQLRALARDLRAAGRRDLRRELNRGLRRAASPLIEEIKGKTGDYLPGGVADLARTARYTTRALASGRVSIKVARKQPVGGKQMDLAAIDRGRLRHPIYGNRRVWALQAVRAGWFTQSIDGRGLDEVREEMVKVLDSVADQLAAGQGGTA